jgi:hypothetical protein
MRVRDATRAESSCGIGAGIIVKLSPSIGDGRHSNAFHREFENLPVHGGDVLFSVFGSRGVEGGGDGGEDEGPTRDASRYRRPLPDWQVLVLRLLIDGDGVNSYW